VNIALFSSKSLYCSTGGVLLRSNLSFVLMQGSQTQIALRATLGPIKQPKRPIIMTQGLHVIWSVSS